MKAFEPARRLRGIEKSAIRQFFDRAPAGSINFGLGEPDLPTPEVVRQAAVRAIQEERNGYTAHAGLPALRERVAGAYGADVGTDRVIITAGSQEALYLALTTLVDEGDEVLLPDPGFVAYPTIVAMAGGRPVFYKLPAARDFAFDAADFKRRFSKRTRVVVCISPSNPTGRALTAADLQAMAAALEGSGSGAIVVSDEIYRDLYFGETRPPTIADYYRDTVVVSGLSKSMSMTGWRLGWLCGPADVVRSALVLHGYVTTCASTISQKAALAAWTPEAESARAAARRIFRTRRDHLLQLLRKVGLRAVEPDGAFYTMMDVSAYGTSMAVAEALLERAVITVPGDPFGSEAKGFLRVSFCAGETALTEGARRIGEALAHMKPRQEQPV